MLPVSGMTAVTASLSPFVVPWIPVTLQVMSTSPFHGYRCLAVTSVTSTAAMAEPPIIAAIAMPMIIRFMFIAPFPFSLEIGFGIGKIDTSSDASSEVPWMT